MNIFLKKYKIYIKLFFLKIYIFKKQKIKQIIQ